MIPFTALVALSALFAGAAAQNDDDIPSSYPHVYPGQPSGDYSPVWQGYFQVTNPLPNVTVPINRNWAGSVSVDRAKHPNDTLFFWAYEKEDWSFTSTDPELPWGIWINGGPGASSMIGMLTENGPLRLTLTNNIEANNYSWDKFMDFVWIDQPVGTGYSTADRYGYIEDEDQMAADFFGFLSNFVKIFPGLAKRPLYLTGESYAGIYISYIMKAYFEMNNPPVKIIKIAMGNSAFNSMAITQQLPAIEAIGTYPQTIAYDQDVYAYFQEQTHLCGYDLNLTYPQIGHLPPVADNPPKRGDENAQRMLELKKRQEARFRSHFGAAHEARSFAGKRDALLIQNEGKFDEMQEVWQAAKNRLSGRANGTIDPWYGCYLNDEMIDFATNFSLPWTFIPNANASNFEGYAMNRPPMPIDPAEYLNDNRTRAALHAPTSKNFTTSMQYPFNSTYNESDHRHNLPFGDSSLEPAAFFDELATNFTAHNITVVIYSGNDDSIVAHLSNQALIQNTTFGGKQGFMKKPQTAWYDDNDNIAGIVHQERNWTYVVIAHAGHEAPYYAPELSYVFFREFVLGNNQTGLVLPNGSVVGGEQPSLLQGNIFPGDLAVTYQPDPAAPAKTSTYVYPSETVSAWETFFSSIVSASSAAHATTTPN